MYAGSFVVAEATAEAIRRDNPPEVTIVAMGWNARVRTDEDELCALYLRNLMQGRRPDPEAVRKLVLASGEAAKFGDPKQPHFHREDLEIAIGDEQVRLCDSRGQGGWLSGSEATRMNEWTIQRLLTWVTEYLTQKGVDSPRLSAELLLSNVLGLKRIELYTQYNKVVAQEQLDRLRDLVKRAGLHEPVVYLVGRTEFYSIEFEVTPDCLIPRPETELLVQRSIEFLRKRTGPQLVCDLCTGCGVIAVAIAKNVPDAKVIATDISEPALAVAARNVEKHTLDGAGRIASRGPLRAAWSRSSTCST